MALMIDFIEPHCKMHHNTTFIPSYKSVMNYFCKDANASTVEQEHSAELPRSPKAMDAPVFVKRSGELSVPQ